MLSDLERDVLAKLHRLGEADIADLHYECDTPYLTLFPALRRLEGAGLVTWREVLSGTEFGYGPRRLYRVRRDDEPVTS